MSNMNEISSIFKRILAGDYNEADIEELRKSFNLSGNVLQSLSQNGKFNTNIGQILGGEVHLGDKIYQGADAEAIRKILQDTFQSLQVQPLTAGIPENLPRSGVVQFVGREQELETLHQQLQQTEKSTVTAVVGMGGVGKTELVVQYALQYKQHYLGGICWLQARGVDIGTQLVQFARSRLQLNPSEELDLSAQVGFCWAHWPLGEVLLIIDDVTDYNSIKFYLPPAEPRFRVLITTRLKLGKSVRQFEIEVFNEFHALELLGSLAGKERIDSELDRSRRLCEWLGYLPLGLELVGRYLDRKPDLSIAEMQKRLEKKRLEERSLQKADADMTRPLGVSAAFNLSWDTLDNSTKQLACLLSLFAAAPIPWKLVEQIAVEEDPDDLEEMRDDNLINLHLLQRKAEGNYQLHQLIREFLCERQLDNKNTDEQKQKFCEVIGAVTRQFPESPTRKFLLHIAPTIPHVAEVAANLTEYLSNEDLVNPFEGLGRFYENQGFYSQAERWYEQGCLKTKERFDNNHLENARSLSNLASIYQTQGRYEEAETLFTQALNIR